MLYVYNGSNLISAEEGLVSQWGEAPPPKMLERILDIVAEESLIDRAQITPQATLEELGLSSIDVVSVLTGVEEKLGTYLPMDTDLDSVRNLAEFVTVIAKAVAANSSGKGAA